MNPRVLLVPAALLVGCASMGAPAPWQPGASAAALPASPQEYEDHARAVSVAFHVVEYHATNGFTYRREGASLDDALLESASHDLACPRESVRPAEWVSPPRTNEHAFDGCGRRAVYRTAVYTGPSETQGREDIILASLFPLPG